MESKVKVYAKSQNRIALGIINAYLAIYPEATLDDLRKAFPNTINPDCGSKQIFMTKKEIEAHIANGEEWYASARGYFVKEKEWLVMPDGERVGFVSMWTKKSMENLLKQALIYGIEAKEADEKRGTFRLEYLNESSTSDHKNEKGMEDNDVKEKTYYLRVVAENFYRFDVIGLENADDDVINEDFEDEEGWTDIVGGTQCLYTRFEDLENAVNDDDYDYFDDDEDGVRKIMEMVGDKCQGDVGTFAHYPDANEDFSFVVLDENEDEIETIDGADILAIECEQGYTGLSVDDDNDEQIIANYKGKNQVEEDFANHVYETPEDTDWYWLNVQRGPACDEYPVYELKIKGEFDASKLMVKKARIEEVLRGQMSRDVISEIIYDGQVLELYQGTDIDAEECTNLFIKKDSDDSSYSLAVYDMTNKEQDID